MRLAVNLFVVMMFDVVIRLQGELMIHCIHTHNMPQWLAGWFGVCLVHVGTRGLQGYTWCNGCDLSFKMTDLHFHNSAGSFLHFCELPVLIMARGSVAHM